MPAFYEKDPNVPGCVVSFAINKYVYVALNPKFDNAYRISYSKTENVETVDEIEHDIVREAIKLARNVGNGLEITTVSDIPGEGTGLGSSSSLAVGLINALNTYIAGPVSDPGALAELGFITEAQKCGHSVGKQDHYAAAYGGINTMEFRKSSVKVTELKSDWDSEYPWNIAEFEKYFVLLWTGKKRSARKILREQSKRMNEKDVYEVAQEMAILAGSLKNGLTKAMVDPLRVTGMCLKKNWELKKQLHPNISDEQIDFWYEIAMNNGALGGKLCGAGGGGFLLFVAPPEEHIRIVKAVGLRKVPFKISTRGSEIIYDDKS